MHAANHLFWKYALIRYGKYIHKENGRVLECGSLNVNGSIRDILEIDNTKTKYTGLDWRPGNYVDVVSLAHEFKSENQFDAIVSASMLEHDPYWDKSIRNMIKLLKDDGILIMSWGSALNPVHYCETAPDGAFHALPVGKVFDLFSNNGVFVQEFWYERNLCKYMLSDRSTKVCQLDKLGSMGECALVAFKNPDLLQPELSHIDKLVKEDEYVSSAL